MQIRGVSCSSSLLRSYLIEKPRTENHLHEVVDNKHAPKVHWFPVVHDPGAEYLDKVGVAQADGQRRERATHQ
jgi:hypothetical protein